MDLEQMGQRIEAQEQYAMMDIAGDDRRLHGVEIVIAVAISTIAVR
jgi:hypothetical protein